MSEDVKPRIGYVAIEDYTDDYSDWTGQITFPNPKGANIYWQNPIVFIELEPTMRLMDELAEALEQRKCDEAINNEGSGMFNKHDSNCAKCFILEKYRKFLEGIEK